MNTEPIIFKQGEENGIVIERDGFANSIFVNQYKQAIYTFQRLWEQQQRFIPRNEDGNQQWNYGVDNLFSNIIAFCGDRGEGKSSCMTSFANILANEEVRRNALGELFPQDFGKHIAIPVVSEIEWLGVIDPSFFDKEHNLLELLLGIMYAKASDIKADNKTNDWAFRRRKLMEQFELVKSSICLLEPKERIYDSIGEISDLAAGVQLKAEIQKLFKYYLDLVDKKCLLICIDDLDLNIKDGYQMSEMLRKYIINPYCIVLVSVKVEQLIEIIAAVHNKEVKDSGLDWSYCVNMAQKYVAKLLPRGNQVPMPSAEDICERIIKIAEINEKEDKIGLKDLTVKERVVQLIFQKTGYVFYNGQYLSPIVPTNLRSLRHLLSTLEALPDAKNKDKSDNETGREVFKNYFFGTWAARLDAKDYTFAQQLANYSNLSTLNAFVVEYFAKRVKEEKIEINVPSAPKGKTPKKAKQAQDEETITEEENIIEFEQQYAQLYLDITKRTNTSANISFGDVMYVLWLISTITLDGNIQNLIFLIKTVYSMRLYACYNEVIAEKIEQVKENNEHTIQSDDQQKAVTQQPIYIHKADHLYESVNSLQRLTNGSYFSYPQGVLLEQRNREKTKPIGSSFRDRYSISFIQVKKMLEELTGSWNTETKKLPDDKLKLLHFCEYLALCIVRTAYYEEKTIDKGSNRSAKTPLFVGKFYSSSQFAIFDFLQIFYSLCNIEYAYSRFDDITGTEKTLYAIADSTNESLLSEMRTIRSDWYDDNFTEHGMMSDAVIRVVDIQWSIFEEMLRQKHVHRRGNDKDTITAAYKDIYDLGITLYPKLQIIDNKLTKESAEPHAVEFEFLRKIYDKIKDVDDKVFEDLRESPRATKKSQTKASAN